MTFRYNENDIGTSGANNLLLLDENGKIPAVDGSALTNISASGFNGLSYAYTSYNSTDLTPDIDTYYYISQANKTNALGGNEVNINVPYNSDIINGSKFGFSYIHTLYLALWANNRRSCQPYPRNLLCLHYRYQWLRHYSLLYTY
jgi:hypothetical protein